MAESQRPDYRVVACNYAESTSPVRKGSLCYVLGVYDMDPDSYRVRVLARSRSGRWIETVESPRRLCNFRWKTMSPGNPLYDRLRFADTGAAARLVEPQEEAC